MNYDAWVPGMRWVQRRDAPLHDVYGRVPEMVHTDSEPVTVEKLSMRWVRLVATCVPADAAPDMKDPVTAAFVQTLAVDAERTMHTLNFYGAGPVVQAARDAMATLVGK